MPVATLDQRIVANALELKELDKKIDAVISNIDKNLGRIKNDDSLIADLTQDISVLEVKLRNLTTWATESIAISRSIEAFYNTTTYLGSEIIVNHADSRRGIITLATKAYPDYRLTVEDVGLVGIERGDSLWTKGSNPVDSGRFTLLSISAGQNGVDAVLRISPRNGHTASEGDAISIPG